MGVRERVRVCVYNIQVYASLCLNHSNSVNVALFFLKTFFQYPLFTWCLHFFHVDNDFSRGNLHE